jgi:polyhydroxyalkanoate synthesis regulator phasin
MVLDGLRSYVQLASGLTDVTRERARAAAKSLVAQGEAGMGAVLPDGIKAQVGALTDDLVATSRANRTLLVNLVRVEVERSVGRLGLVSAAELDMATRRGARLESRVADLEQQLRQARSGAASSSSARRAATKRSAATNTTSRNASSPAKKTTARKTAAKKSTAKKSTSRKTAAKKSTAKKSTAKKST